MKRRKRLFSVAAPLLCMAAVALFYFGFWTYSPAPPPRPLSELNETECTLGDIEANLVRELAGKSGLPLRVGTHGFLAYAQEQVTGAMDDPRLMESENREWYQLYLVHYLAAHDAHLGETLPTPFWREMRNVSISELKECGMDALLNRGEADSMDITPYQALSEALLEQHMEDVGISRYQVVESGFATRPRYPNRVVCRFTIKATGENGIDETMSYGYDIQRTDGNFAVLQEGPDVDSRVLMGDVANIDE